MTSNTNQNKYVRVDATVVSLKFSKTLFVIQEEDAEKFKLCSIEPKVREYNGVKTYSVAAKLQSPETNSLHGALNLADLQVGGRYKCVFKVYNWKYLGETGISMAVYVGELLNEPKTNNVDEFLTAMLKAD